MKTPHLLLSLSSLLTVGNVHAYTLPSLTCLTNNSSTNNSSESLSNISNEFSFPVLGKTGTTPEFTTNGVLTFGIQSSNLNAETKAYLSQMANYMTVNQTTKTIIKGHGGGDKNMEQLAQDRINVIIDYLSTTLRIDRSRFSYMVDSAAPNDQLDYQTGSGN